MREIGSKRKVLLTAFKGTSAEWLLEEVADYETLFLPNDKVKDSESLIDAISKDTFDYVISFGQRPNIKDKVHIETTAWDGDFSINTGFDCEKLKVLFEQKGISAKISHNAGTSFCNRLYLNGLRYIKQEQLETQMVFVHIPFAENITESGQFKTALLDVISDIGKCM